MEEGLLVGRGTNFEITGWYELVRVGGISEGGRKVQRGSDVCNFL